MQRDRAQPELGELTNQPTDMVHTRRAMHCLIRLTNALTHRVCGVVAASGKTTEHNSSYDATDAVIDGGRTTAKA